MICYFCPKPTMGYQAYQPLSLMAKGQWKFGTCRLEKANLDLEETFLDLGHGKPT